MMKGEMAKNNGVVLPKQHRCFAKRTPLFLASYAVVVFSLRPRQIFHSTRYPLAYVNKQALS